MDYDKTIELNPKYVNAYFNRAFAYRKPGNYQKAFADLKMAARLGDKQTQDYLTKQGIVW